MLPFLCTMAGDGRHRSRSPASGNCAAGEPPTIPQGGEDDSASARGSGSVCSGDASGASAPESCMAKNLNDMIDDMKKEQRAQTKA